MLDLAVACAVPSSTPAGEAYTSPERKVNIVRALTDRVPIVCAEGSVLPVGNQTATAERRLFGADGKLYSYAATTCLVMEDPACALCVWIEPPPVAIGAAAGRC